MFFPIKVNYSFQLNQLKNNTLDTYKKQDIKPKKPRALNAAIRTGSVHRNASSNLLPNQRNDIRTVAVQIKASTHLPAVQRPSPQD